MNNAGNISEQSQQNIDDELLIKTSLDQNTSRWNDQSQYNSKQII